MHRSSSPAAKRRRSTLGLAPVWLRSGRRPALAVCGVLLLVLAWVLYTAAVCRSDGDCWLGERVRMVSESALSPHYDPGEANQRILIYDFAGVRSLKFGSLTHVRQATAVVGDSNKFTMPISCHMAAAVLVLCPLPPKRILIFGMGGGMLPAYVQNVYPEAHLTVVDLEEEVVRLALQFFNVRAGTLLDTVISDGRKWVDSLPREGLHPDKRFDLIIQDACAGHPCSLVTEEGYARLRDRALADGGKLLQNIFSASPRVVRTMQAAVFPGLALLDTGYSNKILIAQKEKSVLSPADAASRARFLRSMGMGPQCFDHGLRHGQTDDIVSVIERRYVPATAPVLQASIIRDDDAEVVALETLRWKSHS